MKFERTRQEPREAIGRAIRAVEDQKYAWLANLSADQRAQRQAFFQVLDRYQEQIFVGITEAATRNERHFNLAAIPGFAQECNHIFRNGARGAFNADMFAEWLHNRDLAHVFRADSMSARW